MSERDREKIISGRGPRIPVVALTALLLPGLLYAAALGTEQASMVAAARDGLTEQVKALLAKHVSVNARDMNGVTPLAWATLRENSSMVELLLRAHADPNISDVDNISPLSLAIENNSAPMVKLLLDNGANPNLARNNGETPLMLAVRKASKEIVQSLLDHKADPNIPEKQFGQTALMWATHNPDLVRMLLAKGANAKAESKSWDVTSPIYTATTGTLGVTGIPWNNEGEFTVKAGGMNALMFAIQNDNIESVQILLDAGLDVNQTSADGTTPLLASLYNWQPLEGARRRPCVSNCGGSFTMRFAPDLKIAKLLFDRGAKANVANSSGYTPLHAAIISLAPQGGTGRGGAGAGRGAAAPGRGAGRQGRGTATVAAGATAGQAPLVRRNGEVIATPADGTPLPAAPVADSEGIRLVKRLLDMGADPNYATIYPTTGPVGSVRVNPISPGSTPYHSAAAFSNAELIDVMIEHHANPNIVRKDGHTPFSVAVMADNLVAVEAMIAHGADLQMIYNPTDKFADPVEPRAEARRGQNVLHIAGAAGATRVISLLAAQGVPLDTKNDHGETPLQLAEEQELFRYHKQLEGGLGVGNPTATRSTATSDAIKLASEKK